MHPSYLSRLQDYKIIFGANTITGEREAKPHNSNDFSTVFRDESECY
jgi:hypothetical protein